MEKSLRIAILIICSLISTTALSQSPVNIVYPIHNGSYPVTGPTGAGSAYVTASFGTTCSGGSYTVKWGFDGASVGGGTFYDEMSAQFTHKLASGWHRFWVQSDCGRDIVKFFVH